MEQRTSEPEVRLRLALRLAARGEGSAVGAGAGLEGIARRIGAVGGDVTHTRDDARFEVLVTVPSGGDAR